MAVLGYILEGLEADLALERELGVKSIEFDRSLLNPLQPKSSVLRSPQVSPSQPAIPYPNPVIPQSPKPQISQSPKPQIPQPSKQAIPQSSYFDFVFLHDSPLTVAGTEMIEKITRAMGRTPETAPVIVEAPRPKAKLYVVLGDRALKKWFPGMRAGPGMWITGSEGEGALVTYSPNYILRFGEVTPAVQKIKKDMWTSLKGVLQRLEL